MMESHTDNIFEHEAVFLAVEGEDDDSFEVVDYIEREEKEEDLIADDEAPLRSFGTFNQIRESESVDSSKIKNKHDILYKSWGGITVCFLVAASCAWCLVFNLVDNRKGVDDQVLVSICNPTANPSHPDWIEYDRSSYVESEVPRVIPSPPITTTEPQVTAKIPMVAKLHEQDSRPQGSQLTRPFRTTFYRDSSTQIKTYSSPAPVASEPHRYVLPVKAPEIPFVLKSETVEAMPLVLDIPVFLDSFKVMPTRALQLSQSRQISIFRASPALFQAQSNGYPPGFMNANTTIDRYVSALSHIVNGFQSLTM